jgi:PKD repeat protein
MKKQLFTAPLFLLSLVLILAGCEKDERLRLEGTASVANFTFAQLPVSDTLPFTPRVAFTNTSAEEFLYQWNFGDNSSLSPEKNPVHSYRTGGSYNVTLTTVGTNGNNSVTKVVSVVDACSNDFFQKLTTCSQAEWTWSTDGDAIRVLSPDATQVFFAGSAAGCQADDVYKFNSNGTFIYDANGQTFDVQAGYSCQAQKLNSTSFRIIATAGQKPKIKLPSISAGRPFIGTTDVVENDEYVVESYTADQLILRGKIEGTGGVIIEVKLKKLVALTLADVKNLLTGGSSKSWRFDNTAGANAIIVGTENNPAEYFGGGPLDQGCQADDVYTFRSDDLMSYNANGATFNGGNIAPNFNCGADRSYSNQAFTFGATTGGVAGIGTVTITGTPPNRFIGTTDVPAENVYRIIEITPTRLVLRAGNGSGTVFQFKFVAL